MINWLTCAPAGELFEIDTALRPNGNSGLLVTSFRPTPTTRTPRQQHRLDLGTPGHDAGTLRAGATWTWRPVSTPCAKPSSRAERDPEALAAEIVAMREKVRAAHPVRGSQFDVKHSVGGMVDVEFVVQYLVLSQGAAQPGLLDNVGNIALLQRAEDAGLLGAGIGHAAADAYRELRRAQHMARLDEQPTHFEPHVLAAHSAAVLALWHAVFG
jgi:[glutamine synthetase] adenylyltransferase / [glutamine synthetase]-adenylyl-L-tyrosine phosphorylase